LSFSSIKFQAFKIIFNRKFREFFILNKKINKIYKDILLSIKMESKILAKPIRNRGNERYFDWIKSGLKTYEGRLCFKIEEWNLFTGKIMKFYDEDYPQDYILVKIISLTTYDSFEHAFNHLGSKLIPNHSRIEVINMYNKLFHYDDEILIDGITSKMIMDNGVVAIGFIILKI